MSIQYEKMDQHFGTMKTLLQNTTSSEQNLNNVISIMKMKFYLVIEVIIILNTETNEHVEPYNELIEKEIGIPFDSIKVSSITQTNDRKILIGTWSDHGLIILDTESMKAFHNFFLFLLIQIVEKFLEPWSVRLQLINQ